MDRARIHEGIRRMRFTDVLGRSERSELSQMEAAELLGISERTFRRWRDRHREAGLAGLSDRRLAPSLRRAPVAEIERMLGLYRDLYRGFTVKHFHEQLGKRHHYTLGLHGDQGASASRRPGAGGDEALGTPQEAAAASDGGNAAASGRLDPCLAAGGCPQL
jgi:Helix-turn-helix domain